MKHSLTLNELELVTDSEILFAKARIIKKVCEMFGGLSDIYSLQASSMMPKQAKIAKISRGENYLGLPYVMLDYPREFDKSNIFAIRTFFWWGNFFSLTLQLAGTYQQQYETKLREAILSGMLNDWFITSSNDAWQHKFEDYYTSIGNSENYILSKRPFIKIAKNISLKKWDEAETFFEQNFTLLINILR